MSFYNLKVQHWTLSFNTGYTTALNDFVLVINDVHIEVQTKYLAQLWSFWTNTYVLPNSKLLNISYH